jgi:hypothetical protein
MGDHFTVMVHAREAKRPFPVPVAVPSVTALDFMAALQRDPSGAAIGFTVAGWDVGRWDTATGRVEPPLADDATLTADAGAALHVWVERVVPAVVAGERRWRRAGAGAGASPVQPPNTTTSHPPPPPPPQLYVGPPSSASPL